MAAIHPRLQTPELRFVLLGSYGEALKKPFEDEWQKTANYQHDDPKLLAHQGNYGVCGGCGNLHIIDSDDLARWEDMEVLSLIPPTFTVESRPNHRQYYVKCKGHFQSGGLYDPVKTEINEVGKREYIHIGDVKAVGGQAVGPGCKHPSGSTYQVVADLPIADVSREHLQSIISKFKTSKKVNTNYQRLEEQAAKAKQRKYAEKDPLDDLQVKHIMPPAGNVSQSGDELRGDHPVHGSKNGGNYVINVSKNVWHCKRCESGGGPALAIAVKHGLISCSEAGPGELRGDLFKQVLKIAKEEYGMNENGKRAHVKEVSDKIKHAGDNILKRGKILKFLLKQYHKNHVNDDVAGKVLFLSYLSGSSLTSNGLQPGITGDAQTGKSDAMDAAMHCLPTNWVMKTGLSDKAAAYIEFVPGQVVHSDDLKWTEGLVYMLKLAMSHFQVGVTYTTVMKVKGKLTAVPLTIPPRLLWWLTSADGAPDDQIESRQYPVDVETSQKHAEEVRESIFLRRASRASKLADDRGILTARYILDQVRQCGPFQVQIPFASWIDYKAAQDYRGQQQFLDLIDSLAVLNFQQRQSFDGWLQATYEDYLEALQIFTSKNESHVTGLTKAELQVVACMTARPEWTQADLAGVLRKSQATISRRLDAITSKTAYVTWTKASGGEKIYRISSVVDLRIFGNVIVKLKPMPTNPFWIPANPFCKRLHRFCRDFAYLLHSITNNSKCNSNGVCINPEKSIAEEGRENPESSFKNSLSLSSCKSAKRNENEAIHIEIGMQKVCKTYVKGHAKEAKNNDSQKPRSPISDEVDTSKEIKAAAIIEFGMAGWVDPAKLAYKLTIPLAEVEAWLQANYEAYDRPGGGIGYKQRRAGEAST